MFESVPVAAPAAHVEGRDLGLLLTMNVIWGLNLVACKLGVDEFLPILLTALRFTTLAVMLVPWLRLQSGQMRMLLQAALLTGPVTFALLFLGIARVEDISSVAIASQLGVPFSTLLSVWLLGEHIHWRRRLGIVLAFVGVAVISLDPHMFSSRLGLLLVAMASFSGALGLIRIKQLRQVRPLELQAWISTSGVLLLLPLSLLLETGQWHAIRTASWHAWAALAYTALMSSLVGHTAWYYLVGKYPVTGLAPITLLTPIFGVVFGVALLGDSLTGRMVVGGAITLLGVYIVIRRERKIFDTGS
jgi:O-acetylserine/cysteine efflux transporter